MEFIPLVEFLGITQKIESELDLVTIIREGLHPHGARRVVNRLNISMADLGRLLNVSGRTLMSYEKAEEPLPKPLSDHLFQIARTIIRTEGVFEDEEKARRWLLASCHALGGHCPLDLLDTITGLRLVENELGRIERGVYS